MEEIHEIREKMHEETAGMNVHDKLLFIREKAAAFKSKYGLTTKPMHRKGEHVASHK